MTFRRGSPTGEAAPGGRAWSGNRVQPPPRPCLPPRRREIRGPASVLAAASAVEPALHRRRRRRESGMDPGSGAGVTKGGVCCEVTGPGCVHAVGLGGRGDEKGRAVMKRGTGDAQGRGLGRRLGGMRCDARHPGHAFRHARIEAVGVNPAGPAGRDRAPIRAPGPFDLDGFTGFRARVPPRQNARFSW